MIKEIYKKFNEESLVIILCEKSNPQQFLAS